MILKHQIHSVECSRRIGKIHVDIRTQESTKIGKKYDNQKEGLNKWVFRLLLKESGDMECLMTIGRLFHKVGPAWAKACSSQVFVDFGTTRVPELDERKALTRV